ncbi:MAG: hypothetical protein JSS67_09580 [Bacteroidetes bacterium]|nr:hypothetical protein [Bacteroidota bacterium]
MKILFIILFSLIFYNGYPQCKTYQLTGKGDTLNCVDQNDLKQGKWITRVASLRGEPGYQEIGFYKDNRKTGEWQTYSLIGDPVSIVHYRWGYKDGQAVYYNLNGVIREESWKAIDPKNPYDTVDVPDLNSDTVFRRIIKVESSTIKQGVWKYYDPQTGRLIKTEEYVLDQLVDPKNKVALNTQKGTDSTSVKKPDPSKVKPPEVLQYEKKNEGKKKIKVRDGATGG